MSLERAVQEEEFLRSAYHRHLDMYTNSPLSEHVDIGAHNVRTTEATTVSQLLYLFWTWLHLHKTVGGKEVRFAVGASKIYDFYVTEVTDASSWHTQMPSL